MAWCPVGCSRPRLSPGSRTCCVSVRTASSSRPREGLRRLRRGRRMRAAATGHRRPRGFPQDDRKKIFAWSNEMMAYDDPEYDVDPANAAAEILGYAAEMGEDRKANPREDIVSRLVSAADDEVLSSEEFAFFVLILAVAGNETTRNADQPRHAGLLRQPRAVGALQDRAARHHRRRGRSLRHAGPDVPADRHRGRRDRRAGHREGPTGGPAVRLGELRRGRIRRPAPFDILP